MEWFKVSSLLPTDPKWKRLSSRAKVTYIEWACEIAQHETDGIYHTTGKQPACVDELIEAGLVVTVAEGYDLPAYLKWNKTHAELEAQREHRRRAGAIGGSRSPKQTPSKRLRFANDVSEPEVEVEVEQTTTRTKHLAPRKRDALFEAVAEACGIDWESDLTPAARGALNKAVAELRGVGATPDEVRRRAGNWDYPAKLTAPGLAKQWPLLTKRTETRKPGRGANRHLAALADELEGR